MKNILRFLFASLLLIVLCGGLFAQEKKTIAVLPFVVHSGENIDYVRLGIWDMLSARIAVADKIDVINKDDTFIAIKDLDAKNTTLADIYKLGKKMAVDYIVWGSITKIGNSMSIDGKLVDIAANKPTVTIFTQSQGMDDVILKINDFAKRIDQNILGTAPATFNQVTSNVTPLADQEKIPKMSRESEIASGIRTSKKGTMTSYINPEFINATEPIIRKDFWMSQKYPTEFKGMDIGDVNNDGKNELVIVDNHHIMILQKNDQELRLLASIPGSPSDSYLSVDLYDVNHNGIKEIIVTNTVGTSLESFILEFRDGKFIPLATNLPWFLRVIETASGAKLLCQRRGFETPFDTPIYEVIHENGRYTEGTKMKIPLGLSVYGLTIDSIGIGTSEKIIALDESDYLTIYEQTDKPLMKLQTFGGNNERLWKSDTPYGGSNSCIDTAIQPGADNPNQCTFINLRINTHDAKNNGKKEIIIVKNLSAVGRIFKNVRSFSSSEVYALEWDGLGLFEKWKTKKINGYVADYQFKDIDNDGQKEIVLAIVLSIGLSKSNTSVIVAYKMNPQEGG